MPNDGIVPTAREKPEAQAASLVLDGDGETSLSRQVLALRQVLRLALQMSQIDAQWEYRFVAPKRATWVGEGLAWAEREFNQIGSEGWELVGFLEHGTAVFKRRVATT